MDGVVALHFDSKSALSVPKNAGRRGLYKTDLGLGIRRGRPFLGGQFLVLGSVRFLGDDLEYIFQSKLNQPWVHRCADDLPEGGFGYVDGCRGVELRVVEHVEELRAKHQSRILMYAAHFGYFLDRRIEVKLPGAENNSQAAVSVACSIANNGRRSRMRPC